MSIGSYDYDGLCHSFIYQKKDKSGHIKGSTAGNRMSFNGTRIYSYNSLLAEFESDSVLLIYSNVSDWSNTSRGHYGTLLNAVHPGIETFHINRTPIETLSTNHEMILEMSEKQKRARVVDYSVGIKKLITDSLRLGEHFKLKRSKEYKAIKALEKLSLEKIFDVSKEVKIADKKRREKARAKYVRENKKLLQRKLDKFTGGGVEYGSNHVGVWLKTEDDLLKTSNGISVKLRDALVLYRAWKKKKKIVGTKIDIYTVVYAADDKVKIGCTTICAAELDRVLGSVEKEKEIQ